MDWTRRDIDTLPLWMGAAAEKARALAGDNLTRCFTREKAGRKEAPGAGRHLPHLPTRYGQYLQDSPDRDGFPQ